MRNGLLLRSRARGRASTFALCWLVSSLMVAVVAAEFKPLKLDTTHSRVGFTGSTLLFDVDGHFNKYEVALDGDANKPTQAKVSVSIDAASIDTDNEKRDEHLSGPDFLEVKKFPKITFVSESVSEAGGMLNITGTLDMHGKKKKVTVPFKVAKGKNGAGQDTVAYKGKLTLNRKDFAIGSESVAAKISLEDEIALDLLFVTFP